MKIAEAAEAVLKDARRPLHVRDIRTEIERRMLFEFHAKDPEAVVANALRKGGQFERVAPGTFQLR